MVTRTIQGESSMFNDVRAVAAWQSLLLPLPLSNAGTLQSLCGCEMQAMSMKAAGKEVMLDLEHLFDGYKDSPR